MWPYPGTWTKRREWWPTAYCHAGPIKAWLRGCAFDVVAARYDFTAARHGCAAAPVMAARLRDMDKLQQNNLTTRVDLFNH
jgi:hypothetical protein